MNKAELVSEIALRMDIPDSTAGNLVDAFTTIVQIGLCRPDRRVMIPGFGTWTVRETKARTSRNPHTGEPISVPASRRVHFKPGKDLKDLFKR